MHDIAGKTDGADLVGLDYRLKSEESLKEKLWREMSGGSPELTFDEALSGIRDAIRYTLQSGDELYSSNVQTAVGELMSQGYECIKFNNSWGSADYQGINSLWRDTRTGNVFEVQFHTSDSFAAKSQTHVFYEELRLPTTSVERLVELDQIQSEIFGRVATPPGATDIEAPPIVKKRR